MSYILEVFVIRIQNAQTQNCTFVFQHDGQNQPYICS